jgi:hypothetical protein
MLGGLKPLTQPREVLFAHLGVSAKAGNQRFLTILLLTHVARAGKDRREPPLRGGQPMIAPTHDRPRAAADPLRATVGAPVG